MQDTDWASRDWTYGKILRDKTIVVTAFILEMIVKPKKLFYSLININQNLLKLVMN